MKKRFLSLFMACCMLFGSVVFSPTAVAADTLVHRDHAGMYGAHLLSQTQITKKADGSFDVTIDMYTYYVRIDIDMVRIALTSVKVDAMRFGVKLLHRFTYHTGVICGEFITADNVGVHLELHEHYILLALALDIYGLYLIVGLTHRLYHIGIKESGIGSDASVLHLISADEGDIVRYAEAYGE